MKSEKDLKDMTPAEKNRMRVRMYYQKNRERLKKEMMERYYTKKKIIEADKNMLLAEHMDRSCRKALYYANRKMRDLAAEADITDERLLGLIRKKALEYMYDPGTVIRHISLLMDGHPRMIKTEARKVATIMNETINEYRRLYMTNTKKS